MIAEYLVIFSIAVATVIPVSVGEDVGESSDICRLFKDDTILLKPGYCDRGVKCIGSKSVDLTDPPCTGTKQYFDSAKASCVATVPTPCKDTDPCKKTSPDFVNHPYRCEGWYACSNGTAIYNGDCPDTTYFDGNSQMCVWPSQTTCTPQYKACDLAPSDTKYMDETNCAQYYVCGKITATKIPCAEGLFYDAAAGECIANALKACTTIPIPEDVCGTTKVALRDRFVSDRATCRGYFYCRDLGSGNPDVQPSWAQCPEDTFFDAYLAVCYARANVKCSNDRCDGRASGLELSEKSGCQHYLECQGNVTVAGPTKCAANEYFDAFSRQCVSSRTSYSACT